MAMIIPELGGLAQEAILEEKSEGLLNPVKFEVIRYPRRD